MSGNGKQEMDGQPGLRPKNPNFSCGPCTKHPGWRFDNLANASLGRSHRSPECMAKLKLVIDRTKDVLKLPEGYRAAIVPGSDTGAFEMAMWSLLGARGVDVLGWESFGNVWVHDAVSQLDLPDLRTFVADFGKLPDLAQVDFSRDVAFTWNGTSSGVRVPDGAWIPEDRDGLTLVDATSAVFAQPIDFTKTDVLTFSWQKVLGGEAGHGMIILSPRAIARLESHVPPWPVPKLFRMTQDGKLDEALFSGVTINTPSMMCVEDCLDALSWVESVGGVAGTIARCEANAQVLFDWIARTPWVANLAEDRAAWSTTSVCLSFADEAVRAMPEEKRAQLQDDIVSTLDGLGVAKDIGAYRAAPPGLRIWTGSTVERSDLEALTPWLDWAYAKARAAL